MREQSQPNAEVGAPERFGCFCELLEFEDGGAAITSTTSRSATYIITASGKSPLPFGLGISVLLNSRYRTLYADINRSRKNGLKVGSKHDRHRFLHGCIPNLCNNCSRSLGRWNTGFALSHNYLR
jgi:hypothetical protein